MKILIVEDENVAAQQLKEFIEMYDPSIEVLPPINSCKGLKAWAGNLEEVDLIFCDIELSDGNILSSLSRIKLPSPVIFTTAYDDFWSEALKFNGIDYLLKPLSEGKVHQALSKLEALKRAFAKDKDLLAKLSSVLGAAQPKQYKQRFPVRINNDVFILETGTVVFFRIIGGVIFAFTESKKKFPLETETLNELEAKLNPEMFFRVNRSEVVNAQFIDSIHINSGNEYVVNLKATDEKLSVSNSRVNSLKDWLDNSYQH